MIAKLRGWVRKILRLHGTPRGIAAGFAVGVAFSLIPIPVLGMVLAIAVAPWVRVNVAAAYLGTTLINPITGPFVYFGELWLGAWMLGRTLPQWSELAELGASGWWALFKELLGPFALGAAVSIPVGGALSFGFMYLIVWAWRRRRKAKPPRIPADTTPPQPAGARPPGSGDDDDKDAA